MKQPQMPKHPANYSAKASAEWLKFWEDVADWDKYCVNQRAKAYRKQYYANKTRLRQIAKMKELMVKYPEEARAFCDESN